MPSEYDHVVTAIETLSSDQLDVNFVKSRLLDEEAKRTDSKKKTNASEPSAIFLAKSSWKETNTSKKGSFKYRCYNCDMVGHKRSECKKKNVTRKQTSSVNLTSNNETKPRESDYYCFSAGTANMKNVLNFYLDSGASEHLVCKDIVLTNLRKLERPISIKSAKSGAILEARFEGELEVVSEVDGEKIPILIRKVLSVEGLEFNLISVRKLDSEGMKIVHEGGAGLILKGKTKLAVAPLDTKVNLYKLSFKRVERSVNMCSVIENTDIWHKRLGHLSYENVKKT